MPDESIEYHIFLQDDKLIKQYHRSFMFVIYENEPDVLYNIGCSTHENELQLLATLKRAIEVHLEIRVNKLTFVMNPNKMIDRENRIHKSDDQQRFG